MPIVESTIVIDAPQNALFALSQDYYLRREWDPFVHDIKFLDGATTAKQGVRVWVQAKTRLTMEAKYITVQPPVRVAITMVKGPFFFQHFAGSWVFSPTPDNRTLTLFRYNFRTRWPLLRPLIDPVIRAVFQRDIRARLRALKHAAECTDLLKRVTW